MLSLTVRKIMRCVLMSAALVPAVGALAQQAGESTLDAVKKRGTLIVGIQTQGAPFGYLDDQGRNVGFDADMARYIAKKLGVQVEFRQVTSATRMPLLASRAIDFAAASITVTPEREKVIDFSTPYVMMGGKLLVKKASGIHSLGDLHGKPVAFALGGSAQQDVQRVVHDIEPVVFNDPPLAVQAVLQNKAAAMIADGSQLYYYAQNNAALTVTGEAWAPRPLAIGLRKNDPRWHHEIDALLYEFFADGSYAATYRKYLGVDPDPGFTIPRPSNP
jgi:polar amino acid transport system substrate-binding protein